MECNLKNLQNSEILSIFSEKQVIGGCLDFLSDALKQALGDYIFQRTQNPNNKTSHDFQNFDCEKVKLFVIFIVIKNLH